MSLLHELQLDAAREATELACVPYWHLAAPKPRKGQDYCDPGPRLPDLISLTPHLLFAG